ncbi:hypothetical protein PTTG_00134 [Puccinia triticina 1-1 BBBD Race 1]|uniref:Uncharacterized protein n=1 Tax=Puccinia triticina (isolate 1-1 / race 1 (BBBD)) TaxID=630390 RepID=A0A0C4EHB8_PUCT1|nr:hypothetical protein PTTG_00134 [Puccinia triticina 1-1 BBBD Race 1]
MTRIPRLPLGSRWKLSPQSTTPKGSNDFIPGLVTPPSDHEMAKSFGNPSLMASSLIRVAPPQRLSWLLECSSLVVPIVYGLNFKCRVRLPWGPLLLVPRNSYYLIQWMSRPARGSKELGYTPIPRDSMDGCLQEEEEQESTLGDTLTPNQPVSVSDYLIQPAHPKSQVCPASAPLALHGPSPAPLTSSLKPKLLVNQHKPSVLHNPYQNQKLHPQFVKNPFRQNFTCCGHHQANEIYLPNFLRHLGFQSSHE